MPTECQCDKGGCSEEATHLATMRDPWLPEVAARSFQFCGYHTDGARGFERKYHLGTTFAPLNGNGQRKAPARAFVLRDNKGNELARVSLTEDGTAVHTQGLIS